MSPSDKLRFIGPGLLYAGAAVGVSHLVQSTRAGAEFGFQLVGVILLVNILKYPVFESGPRYAAATGKTLLDGYQRIGNWAVWVYAVLSILTMFIIMAAISIVTAGLFAQLTNLSVDAQLLAVLLLALSVLILGFGHYSSLDRVMKWIIILLTVSTMVALSLAFSNPAPQSAEFMTHFEFNDRAHVLFLVALIGWMPAPIDISIWHSVWSVSKNKEQRTRASLKQSLIDFKIGYWGTTILALCFVGLGAMIVYGTKESPASGSVDFAAQLIHLYTENLGGWAFPFIALAAFTTMFSTLLTCLDAFPRTLRKSTKLILPKLNKGAYHKGLFWFWLILTVIGTSVILLFHLKNMRAMVDLATTLSFITAPVLAILNFIAMNDSIIHQSFRQPLALKRFNLISIALLSIFSVWFLLY
ncbi:MAG: Nramp family divalent metal transporter [Salibacteraceae bacterium]